MDLLWIRVEKGHFKLFSVFNLPSSCLFVLPLFKGLELNYIFLQMNEKQHRPEARSSKCMYQSYSVTTFSHDKQLEQFP